MMMMEQKKILGGQASFRAHGSLEKGNQSKLLLTAEKQN